jgi:hypothetical protein
MAAISCEECEKWIVDVSKEEFSTRAGERQARAPGQPTPCRHCPKESPAKAKALTLSDAHSATLELYLRSRATSGRSLTEQEAQDPILQQHFAIIDTVWRSFDKRDSARLLGDSLPLLSRKGKP